MTNKTQIEELRSHVESAADCGFIHNASIDGRLLASLLDQLEADETRITELEGIVSRQKDTLVKYRKDVLETHAEIAAIRGDAVPVAWTDEEELRNLEKEGFGYLYKADPVSPHADPRRVIKLFTTPQPVPVVVLDDETVLAWGGRYDIQGDASKLRCMIEDAATLDLVKPADGEEK